MISFVLLGVSAVIAAGNGALTEKELCGRIQRFYFAAAGSRDTGHNYH